MALRRRVLALAGGLALAVSPALRAQDFDTPVRISAEGGAIDTEIGHAAPCVYDWNRDGKLDLLVGQFGDGKLRIYLNGGTNEKPAFGAFSWFEAGGAVATVPAG